MTKKRNSPENNRLDPRELRDRRRRQRDAEERRQVLLAVGGILALIVVVVLIGVVNEFIVKPGQPVATVNGEEISTREWQKRVRYQRAQFISTIEEFYDTTNGNVGLVQQLLGQQMQLLLDPEQLGLLVLNSMVDERLIREAAQARGIQVTADEVQKAIEEQYNYYGGALPTPLPAATETVIPTPSLTPIPTAVITEVVPTLTPFPTFTPGPTQTPAPTATPVSQESFDQEYGAAIRRLKRLGGSEAIFREVVEAQLYRDKLTEALAEDANLPTEELQASIYVITAGTKSEADQVLSDIQADNYLDVWNQIRSTPPNPDSASTAQARELLWSNSDRITTSLGNNVAIAALALDVGVPSNVITQTVTTGEGDTATTTDSFHIIMVSGREMRPLTESALNTARQQNLSTWLDSQRVTTETLERWRARVPKQPALDPKYLAQPTPIPQTPLPPTLEVATPAPAATEAP
ncbi:MAG: SurA N-terminal domain-containing protein [Anaerolineales bacterium]|nr:SurA N-terminal domain-containing protein [Anaerolineales bacterium]MCB8951826.1 SurA N-terminal domain-containing protein [Ardenticatenales bacterium]